MRGLVDLADSMASGRTSAVALTEACLARISDPGGEGALAFRACYGAAALEQAASIDRLRRDGRDPGRYAGIPFSLKDLFDVAGEPTPAGSRVLADAPPARADAPVIARMRAAGFVPVGRTGMTEFAFSGLGMNPHYGTPASPWDRAARHIPGGSSSGAAVSVADGMAWAALGTDTGGSCRIPAAFCGVVGYKPTARTVPITGVLPLAPSLDSVGPLANTVACCAIVHAVLAGETPSPPTPAAPAGMRLVLPRGYPMDDMDGAVAAAFERALGILASAGAQIALTEVDAVTALPTLLGRGTLAAAEAWAWHRDLIARQGAGYDPRVRVRIEKGGAMTERDITRLHADRARLCAGMAQAFGGFDAMVMPTVPIVPPPIAALADDTEYGRVNALVLRNTTIANVLDLCAISIPCHAPGEPPVGLMLVGPHGGDAALFALAAGVEAALGAAL